MVEMILVFVSLFTVMTAFVLFIDKLADTIDTQFHSTHHNNYEKEDTAEKLVD